MSHLHEAIQEVTTDFIKPETDSRKYRGLKLKNGLKVLIIYDADADKAAAAMNVNVGFLSDPEELPGLAHFCEHMLFLGTKKYPGENTYSEFIATHGGSTNAYTGMEDTNFHFDVSPDQFREALEIFAQFFLEPLFTESATEREINAVNQENDRNIQTDSWRIHQLERTLSKAHHAYHKFGTGNKRSLEEIPKEKGINVRDELLKFHNKYYSANLMGLALLSKEPLDDMTQYVCDLFSKVKNNKVVAPSWNDPPYGPTELRRRVYVVPVKDVRRLSLLWPSPDLQPHWECKPEHYIGHLLGHEGPGSLLSALKANGWCNTLCAGGKAGASGFSFITIDLDVTVEGLDHIDEIITLAYQYIGMLKKEGPQKWIYEEGRDLNEMNFRFRDNEKPNLVTTHVSSALRLYPMKEVTSGSLLWKYYEPELISSIISLLTPENMMSIVVSKSYADKADKKEEWYGVEYSIEPHSLEQEQMWRTSGENPAIRLPEVNTFIPHNFELCERDAEKQEYPRIIKDTLLSRCWFRQDDEFLLPKGCMTVAIRTPLVSSSPTNANLTWLFLTLFNDKFAEHSYDAELTKLKYSLNTAHYGLTLAVSGYTDKLHVLLETLMTELTTFKPDEKRVAVFREQYTRGLKNFQMAQPTQQAEYRMSLILKEGAWTMEELLECVDEMTTENVTAFIPQLLSRIHLEALVFGNFTVKKGLYLIEIVENAFVNNLKSKPLPLSLRSRVRREVQIPNDSSYLFCGLNDIQPASCVSNYYQLGMEDTHFTMLLELFVKIIKDPVFHTLRTQEQLGYIVQASFRRASGVHGLQVIVQSGKHPEYVDERIENFLHSVEELIDNMTETDFQKYVTGLISARLAKPKKIAARHSRYWSEIVTENYQFDRDNIETEHVRTITKDQIKQFYKEFIHGEAGNRSKLSVQIRSKDHRNPYAQDDVDGKVSAVPKKKPEVIECHIDFKRCMQLFPLPKPSIIIPQPTVSKL